MDHHEEIHAFTSRRLEAGVTYVRPLTPEDQLADRVLAPAWWRIRDLEASPPKLAGARLEGPSQGWPA